MPSPIHILTLALVMSSAGLSHAQPAPDEIVIETTPETETEVIEEWIEQLESPDWLMRDLATLELAELDPGISLETLERYITHNDLSIEQRSRLWLACLRRFEMRPKGALGVQFGEIQMGAIEVIPIPDNPEFPASMVLRQGDKIALVADRLMEGTFSLRAEILSRDPGEILPVTLIRNTRPIRFDLRLGAYSNLTGGARMDTEMLVTALQRRWDRRGISIGTADTVGDAINRESWAQAAFPEGVVPDPREPELIAPRGIVFGPGMRSAVDGTRWDRTIIDVWTDPADFRNDSDQRGSLILGEQLQPLIALQDLYVSQQLLLKVDMSTTNDADTKAGIESELAAVQKKLDRIRNEIESTRATSRTP